MKIGEKIKQRRQELKWSQRELCSRMGYSNHSTIAKIEAGAVDIPQSKIVRFSEVLDVDISYLMGWEDKPQNANVIPYKPESMIPIPVIGTVAAGYTSFAETDIDCYELVSPEMINDGYEYVYLKVVGDSMEPLLVENDKVLVRIQSSAESGDYVVAIVDEEDGVVKKYVHENDTIILVSENPYYPPRIFKGKEAERVRIFGKVVESKRSFL